MLYTEVDFEGAVQAVHTEILSRPVPGHQQCAYGYAGGFVQGHCE